MVARTPCSIQKVQTLGPRLMDQESRVMLPGRRDTLPTTRWVLIIVVESPWIILEERSNCSVHSMLFYFLKYIGIDSNTKLKAHLFGCGELVIVPYVTLWRERKMIVCKVDINTSSSAFSCKYRDKNLHWLLCDVWNFI